MQPGPLGGSRTGPKCSRGLHRVRAGNCGPGVAARISPGWKRSPPAWQFQIHTSAVSAIRCCEACVRFGALTCVHVLPPVTGTTGRPLPRPGRVKRGTSTPGTHTAAPILVSESGATCETQKAAPRFTGSTPERSSPCCPSDPFNPHRRIRHHPPANSDSRSTG